MLWFTNIVKDNLNKYQKPFQTTIFRLFLKFKTILILFIFEKVYLSRPFLNDCPWQKSVKVWRSAENCLTINNSMKLTIKENILSDVRTKQPCCGSLI